jgi:hypothetical protein
MNLGRVPVNRGKVKEALAELKWAIGIEARYTAAHQDLHRVPGTLN